MGNKINFAILLSVLIKISNARLDLEPEDLRRPFDQELYRNVLDPVACRAQLASISQGNSLIMLRFLDAGVRTPRGVLEHNMVDMGNYYQCLEIDETVDEDMRINGKYCMIQVPTDQNIQWPQFMDTRNFQRDNVTQRKLEHTHASMYQARAAYAFEDIRSGPNGLPPMVFRLAVCIPKPCSTQEAVSALLFNGSDVGFRFEDEFCRLPNDKPWVAADTVAVVVFSLIGLLTLLSTCYDLYHTMILKRDPKSANAICNSFSVYTNRHNVLTFKASKGALECLDGIRVISMMWVIVGHALAMHPVMQNAAYLINYLMTPETLWLTVAPIAVDTFFMIGGVLLVYTTVGKMTGHQLVSKLHLFYLHRLLRMFPALAALVLLNASVFFRIADGPLWSLVSRNTQRCRTYWWATLLHIQNHLNPLSLCINHTWYIAIDIQVYIVSPLVLFWVLSGNKRSAWIALVAGLLAILTSSTIYIFLMKLPGGTVAFNRWDELQDFLEYYYFNSLTRGAPVFVGMIFGYILHLCRGIKVELNFVLVILSWLLAIAGMAVPFYTTYLITQPDWDNQTVDSLVNSFQRSVWAAAIGWLVFACVHGYGGPINWFLSLPMWKLPSRLSYAMYLYHFPIMYVVGDRQLAPVYFNVADMMFDFLTQFSLVTIVAFVVAVVIEAPFSILFKIMLDKAGSLKSTKSTEVSAPPKNLVTSN